MMPIALLLAAWLACAASAGEVALEGIDVYGTQRLTADDAEKRYGKLIRDWAKFKSREGRGAAKQAEDARKRATEKVRKDWGFAWTQLSWSDYYAGGAHKAFVTIDVVEPENLAARLAFKKPPVRSLPDPGGLLAAYKRYSELGWTLFKAGQLSVTHDSCISFFCEWGAQTPELRAYEELFIASAKESKEALIQVMLLERDPAKRAWATFLLSYLPDAGEAARIVVDALDDGDVEVRGAALRVFADYAVHHQAVPLPLAKLRAALDFPTDDDRTKAMAVVAGLASNPAHRRFLILKAGGDILRLMQSRQPAISDTAYAAIGILSGQEIDRRDLPSWERWLERAKAQELDKPEAAEPSK